MFKTTRQEEEQDAPDAFSQAFPAFHDANWRDLGLGDRQILTDFGFFNDFPKRRQPARRLA
jgi:hypothetical protein